MAHLQPFPYPGDALPCMRSHPITLCKSMCQSVVRKFDQGLKVASYAQRFIWLVGRFSALLALIEHLEIPM